MTDASFRFSPGSRRAQGTVLAATLVAILVPAIAAASLGGDRASVQVDRAQMKGALRQIIQREGFGFIELQSAAGVVVREYVSSDGTVFGIAWQGAIVPDLRQLLGPYFVRYQQAAERLVRARRGHGPLMIDLGDAVVQTGGRPRSLTGRAFLPRLFPQGVQPDVVR
jgi:hypothetical protein